MLGRDYRVKLDFTYIPKNAYEDELFFEIVQMCKDIQSAPALRDTLLIKDKSGKDFWEKRGRKSSRATVEVIRDILDFAAYCGMIMKTYPLNSKRAKALYQLTGFGEKITNKFLNKDKSVQNELVEALMHYKVANNQLDFETYIEFNSFRVRPFFILLKILYLFEEKYPNIPLNVDPYDLGFVILSIKNEDDSSIQDALKKLYNLVTSRKSLSEYLELQDSNRDEFAKKTNNCITRLFRWSFCCGLIECKTSGSVTISDFFEKWKGFRVNKVLGISGFGKEIFSRLKDTYYYWEKNLHTSEVIILETLKNIKEPINKNELFKYLENKKIVNKVRYERQLSRLKSIFNLQEKDRELSLTKIPIFDGLNINLINKVNDLLTEIKPTAKLTISKEPLSIEVSVDDSKETYDFVKFNNLISRSIMEEYSNMFIDRYFFDYWPLSIGDQRLKKRYTDIRYTFELKTAMLFKQMNFSVTSFGQKTRGTSSIDILANWSRISQKTNHRKDRISIIECKSSKNPYNLSLKDIDDRVRQIGNLIENKKYKPVRTLISSLLFVSSSWGSGGNEEKIEQIKERVASDLRLQINVGLIGSKQLLYLNSKYKRNPQKFEDFDFDTLFRNDEINHSDIDKIFK